MGGPSFPTSFFIQSYISRFEYSAQVLKLHRNRSLFFKVQRQQYRIIRSALGFRQFTPINILLAKSCEPPLELRFALLSSRYVYKCFARSSSLVVRSLRRLEIESAYSSRTDSVAPEYCDFQVIYIAEMFSSNLSSHGNSCFIFI